MDDEALIDAVVRGDVRRAGTLHDRSIATIEATLFRVLGKREVDHDDLVQATFEQVVVTLMRGRFAGGCSLSTWASSVAAHVAFNSLRGRRRARHVFDPVELADVADPRTAADPERQVGAREEIRAVQKHLAAMSSDKAMILLLHDVLGHELSEIAVMVGASVAAAQSRLVRARRVLLKRLDAEERSKSGGRGHA